ncbi:hypothetical protein GYMLUDRAFT_94622 [Collybiopsis luxurians FD-317 M1]|nr:hypothetical protein GYMLUDRAFT_94622 [Collybiopsis luxurians FD-317 M1]
MLESLSRQLLNYQYELGATNTQLMGAQDSLKNLQTRMGSMQVALESACRIADLVEIRGGLAARASVSMGYIAQLKDKISREEARRLSHLCSVLKQTE